MIRKNYYGYVPECQGVVVNETETEVIIEVTENEIIGTSTRTIFCFKSYKIHDAPEAAQRCGIARLLFNNKPND